MHTSRIIMLASSWLTVFSICPNVRSFFSLHLSLPNSPHYNLAIYIFLTWPVSFGILTSKQHMMLSLLS